MTQEGKVKYQVDIISEYFLPRGAIKVLFLCFRYSSGFAKLQSNRKYAYKPGRKLKVGITLKRDKVSWLEIGYIFMQLELFTHGQV